MMDDRTEVPARIAEVAHELRAPLGGVRAMAELLATSPLNDQQMRLVVGLLAAADHLQAISDDLLSGGSGTEVQVPLQAVLDQVDTSVTALASRQDRRFVLDVTPSVPLETKVDGRRLRQMLENLIENAAKAAASGAITLRVTHEAGPALRFSVLDEGPGFPPGVDATLFARGARFGTYAKGSGLGLALVRQFAESMGGRVGAMNREGGGAEVWFTLALEAAPATSSAPQGAPARPRILVVDDNAPSRMILATIMEFLGCDVVSVDSGETALDTLKRDRFDAITLDYQLAGMNGLMTTRAVRGLPGPAGLTPIIAVTGSVGPSIADAFATAGANGYVAKPVTARTLLDAMAAVGVQPAQKRG